jgi:hypothetical protein
LHRQIEVAALINIELLTDSLLSGLREKAFQLLARVGAVMPRDVREYRTASGTFGPEVPLRYIHLAALQRAQDLLADGHCGEDVFVTLGTTGQPRFH